MCTHTFSSTTAVSIFFVLAAMEPNLRAAGTSLQVQVPSPPPPAVQPNTAAEGRVRTKPTAVGFYNALAVEHLPIDGAALPLARFTSADTSSVARMKDGRIVVAYQGFPAAEAHDFNRTAVRFSKDEGCTWTGGEPIVVDGLDASLAPPFDPALVALPDGRVRLYFISFVAHGLKPGTPPTATAVYSAISTDGLHYTFEPGIRFTVDGRVVLDATAALHNGVFHIVVPDNGTAAEFIERRKNGETPPGGNGYHAMSKDGLVFERAADLKFSSTTNRWWGNLLSDGGTLFFFGTGPGPWPLTSADGMQWKVDARPIAMPGVDPAALRSRDGGLLVIATKEPLPKATGEAKPPQSPAPETAPKSDQNARGAE
jgi:hypothetical protein